MKTMKKIFNILLEESLGKFPKVKLEFKMSEDDIEITVIIVNINIYTLNSKEVEENREIVYLFEDVMKILMEDYTLTQIFNCILKRKEFTKIEKFKLFLKILNNYYYLFYHKLKKDVFEINKLFCKELEKMDLNEFLY